ncbi:MAG: adenylyl-sulfate kinase [Acidimicrobiales bacterium]
MRHGLNSDLGFGPEARDENVRRVSEVAGLFAEAGNIAIVCLVSPYEQARQAARALHERAGLVFVEVFVDTPVSECERRGPKGLYTRARRQEVQGLTGVDGPFEPPAAPELVLRPEDAPTAHHGARIVVQTLAALGVVAGGVLGARSSGGSELVEL